MKKFLGGFFVALLLIATPALATSDPLQEQINDLKVKLAEYTTSFSLMINTLEMLRTENAQLKAQLGQSSNLVASNQVETPQPLSVSEPFVQPIVQPVTQTVDLSRCSLALSVRPDYCPPLPLEPSLSEQEMINKFLSPHDSSKSLLFITTTGTAVSFSRSGRLSDWGDARVIFKGQPVLTKDGLWYGEGGYYANLDKPSQYIYDDDGFNTGFIGNLTIDTVYSYQIIYPLVGHEDSVLNATFKTRYY